MKHFNLTDLAYLNLKLIIATVVFHWLSFYDEVFFNPMFIRSIMLKIGFHVDQYILFGLAGIFMFMLVFVYTPVALFDLFIAKLSKKFTKDTSVSPSNIKFKKGKYIENLIRHVTYA